MGLPKPLYRSMKIYFCDGCNESIPLADIQSGQVTTIKGKLFCRGCIPPGGTTAVSPSTRRGTSAWLVLTVLALVAWAVYRELPGWMMAAAMNGGTPVQRDERGLDLRLSAVEADLDQLRDANGERGSKLSVLRADLEIERATSADRGRTLDQLRDTMDRLGRGQAETGQLIERVHLAENRAAMLEERVNTLADMVAAQTQAMKLVAQRNEAQGNGQAPETAFDATLAAELDSIRRQLLDEDAGQRFDGVERIADGRLKALAPELVTVLGDEDRFVRMQAMQVLGDFGHVEAIPALLNVLADPSVQIRKIAGETLVRLTGYDPGYDAQASDGQRGKAADRWRAWIAERSRE